MLGKPYFRPGVGAIVYNANGEILIFSRTDKAEIWQFPQGGLESDETVEAALWRELEEETALHRVYISIITEYPDWTIYSYPDFIKDKFIGENVLGQAHRWFFLKLKPGTKIDLTIAHDKEFSDYKWTTFTDLKMQNDLLKKKVYEELSEFFISHITMPE